LLEDHLKKVGFGIIGSGIWSGLHAQVYSSSENVELAGVTDVFENMPDSFSQVCSAVRYDNVDALLADASIEAVSILTPDFTRAEVALACVKAGKHILVEPPIALHPDESREIMEAARVSGSKIMVDFRNRWINPLRNSKDSIDGKEIGGLQCIDYHSIHRVDVPAVRLLFSEKTTVGWYSGIHSVDTLRWLTGSEVKRVFTVARSKVLKSIEIDTPDFYQSILEFESGVIASVEDTWIFPQGAENVMEIACRVSGSRGVLFVENGYTPEIFKQSDGFAAKSVEHFIDCVVNDIEPAATAEDDQEAARVVRAMEESAHTGHPVDVR
jgi:predicted dehydrogenase